MPPSQSVWNSLEIAKITLGIFNLVVSCLTPLILVGISFWIARLTERFKAALWTNQKVIEKRIEVYDKLAPMLNDLYCFFYYVGNWKELTPMQIIDNKRYMDKTFYIYKALFSPKLCDSYFTFIHLCFETYDSPGKNAGLLTTTAYQTAKFTNDRKKVLADKWEDTWDEMFSDPRKATPREKIKAGYDELMLSFSEDIGIRTK